MKCWCWKQSYLFIPILVALAMFINSISFAASLITPTLIAPGESVNSGHSAIDTASISFRWNKNNTGATYVLGIRDITGYADDVSSSYGTVVASLNVGDVSAVTWSSAQTGKKYRWTVTAKKTGYTDSTAVALVFTTKSPAVTSIWPTTATRGVPTTFTVYGSNLASTIAMSLQDAPGATPFNVTSTSAQITLTPGASGTKSFYVAQSSGGAAISGSPLTVVVSDPAPSVSSIYPTTATRGVATTFTVYGSNLTSSIAMSLQDAPGATPFNVTSTSAQITLTPGTSGAKSFYVARSSGGAAVGGSPFTIQVSEPAPRVTSISPTTATRGMATTFTVYGSNLASTIAMSLQDAPGATPFNVTSTSAQITLTPGASGAKSFYVAQASGGSPVSGSPFTVQVVEPASQVTSISPTTATLGVATTFTVSGSNLPSTVAMSLQDAPPATPFNVTANSAQITLTPGASGTKSFYVAQITGGSPISGSPFSVQVAASDQAPTVNNLTASQSGTQIAGSFSISDDSGQIKNVRVHFNNAEGTSTVSCYQSVGTYGTTQSDGSKTFTLDPKSGSSGMCGYLFTSSGAYKAVVEAYDVAGNKAALVSYSFNYTASNQPVQVTSAVSSISNGSVNVNFTATDPEALPMGYEVWLFDGITPVIGTKKTSSPFTGGGQTATYSASEVNGKLTIGGTYRARIWVFDNTGLKTEVYTPDFVYGVTNQPPQVGSVTASSTIGTVTLKFAATDPEAQTMGYEVWLFNGSIVVSNTRKVNSSSFASGQQSVTYTAAEVSTLLTAGSNYRARIWVFDNSGAKTELYSPLFTYNSGIDVNPSARISVMPSSIQSGESVTVSLAYNNFAGSADLYLYTYGTNMRTKWFDGIKWTTTKTKMGTYPQSQLPLVNSTFTIPWPDGVYYFGAALVRPDGAVSPKPEYEALFAVGGGASDTHGKTIGSEFEYVFKAGNRPPIIESLVPSSDGPYQKGQSVELTVIANDPDTATDSFFILWDSSGGMLTGNAANAFKTVSWTAPDMVGRYVVVVTVGDGAGKVTSMPISMLVQ